MIINTVGDRYNMTHDYYIHPPSYPLESNMNIIIAKNPQLLENTKHILIRKKNFL